MWPALHSQWHTAVNETCQVFDFEELKYYQGQSDSEQVNTHDDFSLFGKCHEETKPPSCKEPSALAVLTR